MPLSNIRSLLKLSVVLIFIGRAWQHIFWDAPYRSFFWDEYLLQPIVEGIFNTPWQDYATNPRTDDHIQTGIQLNGVLYILAAISAFLIKKSNFKWLRIPIAIGGFSLVLLAVLLTKEKFYHSAQFFEHSIQFGLPFILLYSFKENLNIQRLIFWLKITIAFTFFSHGLYSFGFYPVPGKFVDMVITILGTSEHTSITFLYIAGILDFVVAISIFIPKIARYALWYSVFWGLFTALARIVANFYIDFAVQSIHQNLYETIYRLPHGLVPFIALVALKDHFSSTVKK